MKRAHNEDAYLHRDDAGLYIVADGMGGHAAGEVASWEAIEAVFGMVRKGQDQIDAYLKDGSDEAIAGLRRLMESAIQSATYMVFGIAQQDPEHRGMGTTITAMLFVKNIAIFASVGDSRAYLVREDRVWQVTEDHTLVQLQINAGLITPEQGKNSPRGNVITRAVGPRDYVQVDTFVVPMDVDDTYVLCSDGLHGYLETEELGPLARGKELTVICRDLIDLANSRGGKDNITCVAVRVVE